MIPFYQRYGRYCLNILGVSFYIVSIILWGILIYILPHQILGWHYIIPQWIEHLYLWIYDHYLLTGAHAHSGVFLFLLLVGLLFNLASYLILIFLDKKPLTQKDKIKLTFRQQITESLYFGLQIIFWIILIVLVISLFCDLLP